MKKRLYRVLILSVVLVAIGGVALTAWARTSGNPTTSAWSFSAITAPVRTVFRSAPSPTAHHVTLSTAQISMLEGNRVVVLMDAAGDLPGSLTLTIDRDSAGTTVVGGSWVLIHSYTDLSPLGHHDSDGDHPAVKEQLVQKGTLSGLLSGGVITLDSNGNVTAIDSLMLTINQGSVAYDGVTEGTGSAQETNLQDVVNSTGTLILNF